jgi:predicted CopG family antitoxin
MKFRNYKIISVSLENYDKLVQIGKKNESFSDIIGNLLEIREKMEGGIQ